MMHASFRGDGVSSASDPAELYKRVARTVNTLSIVNTVYCVDTPFTRGDDRCTALSCSCSRLQSLP